MEARGVGTGWLCLAVLCSAAALDLQEQEPGHDSSTQSHDVPAPTGAPTTSSRDVDTPPTWPTATPTLPCTGDPVTTPLATRAGTAGNKTQNASAVPIRYWSPTIFVVVALLVLFFTYRWTKGEGSQDQTAPASDSSDLGALDHVPAHDTTPIIPPPQEERKGPEPPPAPPHAETTFCEPDPPPPQSDTPPAPSGPPCSGEPGAD
ncbi:uncharacterized protein FN964_015114 [Alca torda]